MKYQGSCHCKAVEFTFESSEITTALQCNCSICRRKNALMLKQAISSDAFELIKGKEHLSRYQWGDKDVNHYFCKTCGIYPFHDLSFEPNQYRINLGCVDNIALDSLEIIQFDGKNAL